VFPRDHGCFWSSVVFKLTRFFPFSSTYHPSTRQLCRYSPASERAMSGSRRDEAKAATSNIQDGWERPPNSHILHNSDELDGIHDGLNFPTDEEKESLRRVPDSIPSNVYRELTAMNLFRITHIFAAFLSSLSYGTRRAFLALWHKRPFGGCNFIATFR